MNLRHTLSVITGIVIAMGSVGTPSALHAAPYFEGKTMTMVLGTSPGGRRDRIARFTARFLSKYIPGNPRIAVQNIPGGQGIPAQMKFSRGRTDGSMIGIVPSSDMEAPFFGTPGANYDPSKYVYIGSVGTGKSRMTFFTLKKAGFHSIEDLKSREVVMGAQRVGHRNYLNGRLTGEILDLKIRWVLGYTTPELYIAMERGEIDGRFNDAASIMRDRPDWFDKGEIVAHVSNTLPKLLPAVDHPVFASTPSLMQFAKTEIHRDIIRKLNTTDKLGGAVAFPPGTPDKIRRIVEQALLKAGKDQNFQRAWETEVGIRPFQGVFSADEVEMAVKIYTDWRPEVLSTYKRLGYQPPN